MGSSARSPVSTSLEDGGNTDGQKRVSFLIRCSLFDGDAADKNAVADGLRL